MDNMNETMNNIDAIETDVPTVVAQDTPVSSTSSSLKTAGLAGLAAVVAGAALYYGYKKYKDHKATVTVEAEEEECK